MNSAVRTPALVCAVLSAAQIVVALITLGVPALQYGAAPILWFSVLLAALHIRQLAGVLALGRTGLAGTAGLARAGLGLATLGGLGLIAGELTYLVDIGASDTVFGVASVASGLGMILAGVAVLREGRWAGAARFLPLAIGVYMLVVLMPVVVVASGAAVIVIAGWAVLWVLLGLALAAERVTSPPQSRAGAP